MLAGEGLSALDRAALTRFLPKGRVVDGAMEGAASRPIALLNTSYWMVASLATKFLSDAVPDYVDKRQRGFVRGRMGIVHDIDLQLLGFLLASLGAPWAAIVVLGMEAAFQCLSHRFLLGFWAMF